MCGKMSRTKSRPKHQLTKFQDSIKYDPLIGLSLGMLSLVVERDG